MGSPLRPVDDAAMRGLFERKLTELKKAGETVDPVVLLKQLEERQSVLERCDLPTVHFDSAEKNAFRRAKSATLIFGKLYLCGKCDKWHPSLAGGVLISPDGIAVTNHHVLEGEGQIAFGAMTPDGVVHPVVEVLASSVSRDVAVVRLKGSGFPYAPLAPDPLVGDDVFVVSHPDGRFYSFTEGVVSRYYQAPVKKGAGGKRQRPVFMEITADFAKGSSGSGVFDSGGRLAALVSSTSSIYYDEKKGVDTNLQMVIKNTVPVAALRDLMIPAE